MIVVSGGILHVRGHERPQEMQSNWTKAGFPAVNLIITSLLVFPKARVGGMLYSGFITVWKWLVKDIHAEALAEYVSCLKPMTTRSAFFQGCANFRSESLEALNLEDGKQFTANGKLALKRCEDLYTNVIDKVRKRHQLDKQSAEEKEK